MKKGNGMIIVLLGLSSSFAYTQQNDSCKVLTKEISGIYKGGCQAGLAHGKGVAKGIDTYDGAFIDGFPNGKGTYVYENGNKFTGSWSNGLKNGQGKFVYYLNGKEYVQKGYWKNGDYIGTSNPDEFYRIIIQSGIENCSFKKLKDNGEKKIKIFLVGAMIKYVPQDLKITTSSGQLVQENKNFVIYNYTYPNNCSVNFTIKTSGGNRVCSLSFEILEMGNYEVLITNN